MSVEKPNPPVLLLLLLFTALWYRYARNQLISVVCYPTTCKKQSYLCLFKYFLEHFVSPSRLHLKSGCPVPKMLFLCPLFWQQCRKYTLQIGHGFRQNIYEWAFGLKRTAYSNCSLHTSHLLSFRLLSGGRLISMFKSYLQQFKKKKCHVWMTHKMT